MDALEIRALEILIAVLREQNGWVGELAAEALQDKPADVRISGTDAIKAVAAALTPQWLPIELAPKDGTMYLASDGCDWWKENAPFQCEPGSWSRIGSVWTGMAHLDGRKASHWLPLPSALEADTP